jgi:hypothetical protein
VLYSRSLRPTNAILTFAALSSVLPVQDRFFQTDYEDCYFFLDAITGNFEDCSQQYKECPGLFRKSLRLFGPTEDM